MALATVHVVGSRRLGALVFCGGFRIRERTTIAITRFGRVMVVFVMTQMPSYDFTLVPAVRHHGRPTELERHQGKQEDDDVPKHSESLTDK